MNQSVEVFDRRGREGGRGVGQGKGPGGGGGGERAGTL